MYWDLTSKLSESSLRCFVCFGFLFWLARSLVETELERDISLPSSISEPLVSKGLHKSSESSLPGVTSPAFSSFPNMRSLALLYAASLSSRDNLGPVSKFEKSD